MYIDEGHFSNVEKFFIALALYVATLVAIVSVYSLGKLIYVKFVQKKETTKP